MGPGWTGPFQSMTPLITYMMIRHVFLHVFKFIVGITTKNMLVKQNE